LTGTFLALWLASIGTELTTGMADNGPTLTIDPCVAVDEGTVRNVMELEIRGPRMLASSVSVRCIDGAQEIRVLSGASPETEGIRTIQLPPVVDENDAAARQARSRELALAIAEYIRRLDSVQPPTRESPKPPPSPTPPPPVRAPVVPALLETRSIERPEDRWQLGLLSALEYFSGGQTLAGGDLFVASALGRWFSAELRAGGRLGTNEPLPGGRLTTRAATASAGVGFNLWSRRRSVRAALVLRAQGYLVQFRVEQFGEGRTPTALLGALALAAEPQLSLPLTRHLSLVASAGAGFPLHGIVVRTQGTENRGMSGLIVSASLGGVVTF
jgi:hypothetical protein